MMSTRMPPKTASSYDPNEPRIDRKLSSAPMISAPHRLAMPPMATMATMRTDFRIDASDGPMPPL